MNKDNVVKYMGSGGSSMLKRRILVVDDQPVNRIILKKILQNEYQVLEAENGRAALEVLSAHPEISAVILDIMMPVMDGYDVLRTMAGDTELAKIPVIVSSQKEGDEAEIKALSLGANDFIVKPYKGEIITHRLSNIIKLRETAAMINKAERDELTGLYNKQFFLEEAKKLLRKAGDMRYDMLCIGIERFKLVNDTYGERTGDKVLQHVADVMRRYRQPNMLFGRFMQDDFYIIQPHQEQYDPDAFKGMMKDINEYPIDMEIRIHCGIYPINGMEGSMANICDSAKLAAEANRGRFDKPFSYYDESVRKKIKAEQFILTHMEETLAQKRFQVYYQPKYDLSTELIVGAEALIRWIDPEKGVISPG